PLDIHQQEIGQQILDVARLDILARRQPPVPALAAPVTVEAPDPRRGDVLKRRLNQIHGDPPASPPAGRFRGPKVAMLFRLIVVALTVVARPPPALPSC